MSCFRENRMPGIPAPEIRLYTFRSDTYTINIAPDGSVLSGILQMDIYDVPICCCIPLFTTEFFMP